MLQVLFHVNALSLYKCLINYNSRAAPASQEGQEALS